MIQINNFTLAFLGSPGIGEIGVVLLLIILLFGGDQVVNIAKSLGKATKEFRKTMNDLKGPDSDEEGR